MTTLTNAQIDFLLKCVRVAKIFGIDAIIVEPGKVRAASESQAKKVLLFQNNNVPDMPFGSIGITRTEVFQSRIELARETPQGFKIECRTEGLDPTIGYDVYDPSARVHKTPMWVKDLMLSNNKIKIEYRCANPQTIRAPKKMVSSSAYSVDITPDTIQTLVKGKTAMKAVEIDLRCDDKGAAFIMKDETGSSMNFTFSKTITKEDRTADDPDFYYTYSIDMLLSLLKELKQGKLYITPKGSLMAVIEDMSVYIPAEA